MQKNFVSSKKSSIFAAGFEKSHALKASLARLSSCTTSCARSVSLAQLVEQLTLNQWVEGSSPSGDTGKSCILQLFFSHLLPAQQSRSMSTCAASMRRNMVSG